MHYSEKFVAYIFSCISNLITHIIYIFILVMMIGASEVMERMLFPPESQSNTREEIDIEEGTSIKERYKEDGKRIRLINQVFQA